MVPHGFLGSRADLLMDLALVTFILLPGLMVPGFRLARRGRHKLHRSVQTALFLAMTVAVIVLELDIRLTGGAGAIAGRAVGVSASAVRSLLRVHIGIAAVTWIAWAALVILSRRRFGRILPGAFSNTHRTWGRRIWIGVIATAATGTLLYVAAFAL